MKPHASILILLLLAAHAQAQQIIFFTQDGCAPCRQIEPLVNRLASELTVNTLDVRTPLGQQACQTYKVPRTPTFIAIDANGAVLSRCDGVISEAQLRGMAARLTRRVDARPVAASAHCRIQVAGDGSTGSGTLVDKRDGKGLVVTCAHLFSDSQQGIRVTFADRKSYPATLVERDPANDLAVLSIAEPNAEPVPIADGEPQGKLTAGGYGPNGVFRQVSGEVVGQATPSGARYPSTLMRGAVRPGDSGGGVFDSRGNFVGVVWGHRDGVTYACCGQPVRRLLGRIMGRVTPVPVRPQPAYPPRQDIDPGPPVEPSPGPPQPLPPMEPGTPNPPVIPTPLEPTPTIDPQALDEIKNDQNRIAQQTNASFQSVLVAVNQSKYDDSNLVAILNQQTQILQNISNRINQLQPAAGDSAAPSPRFYDIVPRGKK